jgi:hypothetical protein
MQSQTLHSLGYFVFPGSSRALLVLFFHLLLPLKMDSGDTQDPHDPKDHQAADGDYQYRHMKLLHGIVAPNQTGSGDAGHLCHVRGVAS